ncbi:MAG: hypothetical protein RUMPE_01200 [Eubacteriales bacterium SKADARSKE-1]|nr:hypothetical protein [Eubacteriales bacterium SKADARSKE-1]MDQ5984164.1 hypothetical protein [Eubacteriales bacterium SKADARSKE-1]
MKKLVSVLLTFTTILSMTATGSFALGEDKVVDNEWGDKTYYVSSEKLPEYMEGLKNEVNQCWQEHNDWFGSGSWKGNLVTIAPLITTILFYPFSYKAMKIYNRYKMKPIINAASSTSPDSAIAKIDDSLSWLQFFAIVMGGAATTLISLIISKNYSLIDKSCDCEHLKLNNEGIIENIAGYPDHHLWTYGVEITCEKDNLCYVNSQKYLIDIDDKLNMLPQLEYKGIGN